MEEEAAAAAAAANDLDQLLDLGMEADADLLAELVRGRRRPRPPPHDPDRVVEFLRNSGAGRSGEYRAGGGMTRWHQGIGLWSTEDVGRVAEAAASNACLTNLEVDVAQVSSREEADIIANVLANFRCVTHLKLNHDGGVAADPTAADPAAYAAAVDAMLRGMGRSESPVATLTLTCSGGRDAIVEFAEKCPNLTSLNLMGGDAGGMLLNLSRDFSHGLAAAIGTQWRQQLSQLRHYVAGARQDAARVVAALRASPNLAEMEVGGGRRTVSSLVAEACRVGAFGAESLRQLHLRILPDGHGGGGDDGDDPERAFFECPHPLAPSVELVVLQGFRLVAAEPPTNRPTPPRVLEHVTSLDLDECQYANGVASLLRVLNAAPHLEVLVFNGGGMEAPQLSDDDVAGFAREWLPSRPALTRLTMSVGPDLGPDDTEGWPTARGAAVPLLQNCRGALRLTCHDVRGEGGEVDHLCRGLEGCHAELRSLTLNFVGDCEVDDDHLARFLRAVESNRTLEHLSINLFERWSNKQTIASALLSLLRAIQTLQKLTVTMPTHFVTHAFEGIVAGLAENRSIQRLKVCPPETRSVVPAACLPGLVRALQANHTLRELGGLPFPSPHDHPLAAEALLLLKQNRFGRALLRDAPVGWWAPILARLSGSGDADVVFRFLKTKSDRFERRRRRRGITRPRGE
jgi:hypothetical protein